MPRLTPRRLTGRTLQLSARAASIGLLAPAVRAAGRPLLGLDRLRDARMGDVHPDLFPPRPRGLDQDPK